MSQSDIWISVPVSAKSPSNRSLLNSPHMNGRYFAGEIDSGMWLRHTDSKFGFKKNGIEILVYEVKVGVEVSCLKS